MNRMLDSLPIEIIGVIAGMDPDTCWNLYAAYPQFRWKFCCDILQYRQMFITRKRGRTYVLGMLHSIDDNPAVIVGGISKWYYCGVVHRRDKPAIINKNGWEFRYKHGKRADEVILYPKNSYDAAWIFPFAAISLFAIAAWMDWRDRR